MDRPVETLAYVGSSRSTLRQSQTTDLYPDGATAPSSANGDVPRPSSPAQAAPSVVAESPATRRSLAGEIDPQLLADSPELRFDLSPLTLSTSLPSPNSAPFEWYDLLAEDAIDNIRKYVNLGYKVLSGFLAYLQPGLRHQALSLFWLSVTNFAPQAQPRF